MSISTLVTEMVESLKGSVEGGINRQDTLTAWYRGFAKDADLEFEYAIVSYVGQCKAEGKEMFAKANAEVSKVTKLVNEELGLHYCEENEKYAGMKADLKAERLVVAPTRATKKVKLVEIAKAIVKAGDGDTLLLAEQVLEEFCKRHSLVLEGL